MQIKNKIVTWISYFKSPRKRTLIRHVMALEGKTGIEIGGPSSFFGLKSYLPVYIFAKSIDGVNYSTQTVWEGTIAEGTSFSYFQDKVGYQYIREATDLHGIPANKYDFILSCHCLEHTANPVKALKEWTRVIKPGGTFILVLPDKKNTFDNKRPYTTFEHLLDDYKNNTGEDDTTHFSEVLALHDLQKDDGVKSYEELEQRTRSNFSNRCVHHHVFSLELIKQMLEFVGFDTLYQQIAAPFHLITIAQKKI